VTAERRPRIIDGTAFGCTAYAENLTLEPGVDHGDNQTSRCDARWTPPRGASCVDPFAARVRAAACARSRRRSDEPATWSLRAFLLGEGRWGVVAGAMAQVSPRSACRSGRCAPSRTGGCWAGSRGPGPRVRTGTGGGIDDGRGADVGRCSSRKSSLRAHFNCLTRLDDLGGDKRHSETTQGLQSAVMRPP
jgi:hypothetical protein